MLSSALDKLPTFFKEGATNPLLPCVVLNYFALISCGLYLLEHASWSYATRKASAELDAEAFRRWVEFGDLEKVEGQIEDARTDGRGKVEMDLELVYGPGKLSPKL